MSDSNKELQRMLEDIKLHPHNVVSGMHKGIFWTMRRPRGTFWCGYLHPSCNGHWSSLVKNYSVGFVCDDSWDFTDVQWDEIAEASHWGLTCGLGFDCAHHGDFSSKDRLENPEEVYRDYDYVKAVIYRLIDMVKRFEE